MALRLIAKNYEKHRGVNDQLQNLKKIEDDHLASLTNFNYIPATEDRVQIKIREGTLKDTMTVATTGGYPIQGVNYTEFLGGNETIYCHDEYIYKLDDPPLKLTSGCTPMIMNDFAYFGDKLLIFNGTDDNKQMEMTTGAVVIPGSPPKAKYAHVWHNFVFNAGLPANKNRLSWCNLGDATTWGNLIDRPYGEIMGISSLFDDFYIFFKNKIEKVTGYTSISFQFNDFADTGCISHYGIVSNGSTLFFPAIDGIYAIGKLGATDKTIGGTSLIKISPQKISTFWGTLDLTKDLIHGVHDPDRDMIRWSVRRQGMDYNDREITFNYHENVMGFAYHQGRYINCYTLGKTSENKYEVKFGSSKPAPNGGFIYKTNDLTSTDDSATITGTVITKAYDFGDPTRDKKFNTVSFLMKGDDTETPLKVSYGVGDFPDYTNTKTVMTPVLPLWDDAIWDEDEWTNDTFKNYIVAIRKMGKSLAMKLVSDASGKIITISSWLIKALKLDNKKTTSTI